jgi:hypothetical protein
MRCLSAVRRAPLVRRALFGMLPPA